MVYYGWFEKTKIINFVIRYVIIIIIMYKK